MHVPPSLNAGLDCGVAGFERTEPAQTAWFARADSTRRVKSVQRHAGCDCPTRTYRRRAIKRPRHPLRHLLPPLTRLCGRAGPAAAGEPAGRRIREEIPGCPHAPRASFAGSSPSPRSRPAPSPRRPPRPAAAPPPRRRAHVWITTPDGAMKMSDQGSVAFHRGRLEQPDHHRRPVAAATSAWTASAPRSPTPPRSCSPGCARRARRRR